MGFMAGFGSAFSQSFENARARTAQREDDIFKLTFSQYLKNDEARKEAEKKDALAVKQAKAIAELVPGVNQKAAVAQVYKMLNAGMDQETILEELRKPGVQLDFSKEVRENKQSLEAQTDAVTAPGPSNQKEENRQVAEQTGEAPKRWNDNFLGGLFGSPYSKGGLGQQGSKEQRAFDKAQTQIAHSTGTTREQVQKTLRGVTPPPGIDTTGLVFTPGQTITKDEISTLNSAMIEQAQAQYDLQNNPSPAAEERMRQADIRVEALKRAKMIEANAELLATGVVVPGQQVKVITPDGKVTYKMATRDQNDQIVDAMTQEPIQGQVVPLGEDELEEYSKLAKDISESSNEYQAKVSALSSVMRAAGDMGSLVDQTGGSVLATRTGNLAQWAQGMGADMSNIVQMYENLKSSGNTVGADEETNYKVEEMEQRINGMISQGVNDIGTARALYEAKVKILAYKLAAMEGQDGRNLAETERKLFEDLASGGNSPQKFNQNMANIIFSRLDDLKSDAAMQNNNNIQIEAFQTRYQWPEPPFPIARDPEELILADPKLKAVHDRFAPHNTLGIRSSGSPLATPQSPGQMGTPEAVTPRSRAEYDALPSGTLYVHPSDPPGSPPRRKP